MFSERFLQIKKAQRFARRYDISKNCVQRNVAQNAECKKCGKCGRRFSTNGKIINE